MNRWSRHYSHSRVEQRIGLVGHRLQASPDCTRMAHAQAWEELARDAEEYGGALLQALHRCKWGYAQRTGCQLDQIAVLPTVEDALQQILSSLDLRRRHKVVVTDGEQLALLEQLGLLKEWGVEVCVVPVMPVTTLVERLIAQLDQRTAMLVASLVVPRTGEMVFELDTVIPACLELGIVPCIDLSPVVNTATVDVMEDLADAVVVASGSAHCQLGLGLTFLQVPASLGLRSRLLLPRPLGIDPADLHPFDQISGDGVAYYHAAAVWDFFGRQQLSAETIGQINQRQIDHLLDRFEQYDFDPSFLRLGATPEAFASFISLRSAQAIPLQRALRDIGVHTEADAELLRLGPALYHSREQLDDALEAIAELYRITG